MGKHQKNFKTTADEQQTSTGFAHGHEKQCVDSAESKLVHQMEVFIKQESLNQDCSETGSDELKSQIDAVKRQICGDSSDEERPLAVSNRNKIIETQVKIEPIECTRTEIKETLRSRLTAEQRWIMVEFIKRNKEIVTGRCTAPVVARQRAKVLAQMTKTLNSTVDGAVKTPEKWLKSLQDWKSDVRKKAAKIASLSRDTGVPPMSGLSTVERKLLDLIGEPVVNSHAHVADPPEITSISEPDLNPENKIHPSADILPAVMAEPSPQQAHEPERKRKRRDEDVEERMAAAIERQTEALTKISQQITLLTEVFLRVYNLWSQKTKD